MTLRTPSAQVNTTSCEFGLLTGSAVAGVARASEASSAAEGRTILFMASLQVQPWTRTRGHRADPHRASIRLAPRLAREVTQSARSGIRRSAAVRAISNSDIDGGARRMSSESCVHLMVLFAGRKAG